MSFNLTDTVTCTECGRVLTSSDQSHDCVDYEKREHIFQRVDTECERIVTASTTNAAWRTLIQQVDDPIRWLYYGRIRSKCQTPIESSADYTARTGDVLTE